MMSRIDLDFEMIVSAPFGQNAYVVWIRGRSEALVVDPGFDVDSIERVLRQRQLKLVAILNTHGHCDHIAGNAPLRRLHPDPPLIIGRNEAALLTDPQLNLSAAFGMPIISPAADRVVDDGQSLELAGITLEVREIPGHSPGSVVYICGMTDPPVVLGGDVLFSGSVGRTDLGGDGPRLLAGIRQKLFSLPDSTLVLPGHGSITTIGEEKRTNPFVGEHAGFHEIA